MKRKKETLGGLLHMLICTGSFLCSAALRTRQRGEQKGGGTAMDVIYPHGDVDDMIYQEEWIISTR